MAPGSSNQWQQHRDPAGFDVELPSGWKVETAAKGFVVISSSNGRSFAQVIPLLNRQQACADVIEASFRVSSKRFPDAKIVAIRPTGNGHSAIGEITFEGGSSKAAILCSETGPRSGMIFTTAAPVQTYASEKTRLIRILASFRYSGGQAQSNATSADSNVRFVRWSDPRENAFSAQIPEGWRATGGTMRYTNLEIGSGFRVTSPDQQMIVILNDPRLRTGMTPFPGARVGSPAYGGGLFLPYMTGLAFADAYLRQYVLPEAGLQLSQVVQRRERPDLSATMDQESARYNANPAGPPRNKHGEIVFTATRGGQNFSGYLLCSTVFNPSPVGMGAAGGAIWKASVLGYIAPETKINSAMKIVAHIIASQEVNMQWVQSTQQAGMDTQRIAHDAAVKAGETITSSYWARQASQDRVSDSRSDAMRGQVRLNDGQGSQYTAPSGKNYYYLDEQNGRVIGTDSAAQPSINVRQLEVVQ